MTMCRQRGKLSVVLRWRRTVMLVGRPPRCPGAGSAGPQQRARRKPARAESGFAGPAIAIAVEVVVVGRQHLDGTTDDVSAVEVWAWLVPWLRGELVS